MPGFGDTSFWRLDGCFAGAHLVARWRLLEPTQGPQLAPTLGPRGPQLAAIQGPQLAPILGHLACPQIPWLVLSDSMMHDAAVHWQDAG